MDFYIDVNPTPESETKSKNSIVQQLMEEYRKEKELEVPKKCNKVAPSEIDIFSRAMEWVDAKGDAVRHSRKTNRNFKCDTVKKNRSHIDDLLAKSEVLNKDFETKHAVPNDTERRLRVLRQKEREKTKGDKWFHLPRTEVTDEVKKDLEVLQMRSVLDPKHFYKKNDLKVLPKYFQIGQVVDSPLDYYNNRLTKKERKKTLVDELLADAQFNKYNKKKYAEIVTERQKTHYKAYRQAKKLKRKKK